MLLSMLLLSPVAFADDEALSKKLRLQIEAWVQQAEQGNAQALFNLGQLYRKGVGVEADLQQAELFYRQAAELGHRSAQLNLGTLLFFSDESHSQAKEALSWWQQAAEQGDPEASYQAAMLLFNGINGVAADASEALVWLGKAEENGHPDAAAAIVAIRNSVSSEAGYVVQLGAFSQLAAARIKRSELESIALLKDAGLRVVEAVSDDGRTSFKVQTGSFTQRLPADQLCTVLKNQGQSCFVVHID